MPLADAGPNQAVALYGTANLDGSASSDPNSDSLTYLWTMTSKPIGSTALLSSTTSVNPTFVVDLVGDYVVELKVNDGMTDSLADSVVISDMSSLNINSFGMNFNAIPPGTFTMGSPVTELGRGSDEIQHQVTISQEFHIGTTEVTLAQWQAAISWAEQQGVVAVGQLNSTPSFCLAEQDDCPVESVSWDDVQTFVSILNVTGGGIYSLPTEAQWEYAARAGSTTAFGNGEITVTGFALDPVLDSMGWYSYPSYGGPKPVKQKEANSWGLYDMHGNVEEWVLDYYDAYGSGSVTDPNGPATGTDRIRRGGSWLDGVQGCRSAKREKLQSDYAQYDTGFRLIRKPTQNDADSDGIDDLYDNCPNQAGIDSDGDGLCGVIDPCPADPGNDPDGDGVCLLIDTCPDNFDPTNADSDGDGLGDICDSCANDPDNDIDLDTICGDLDNCPTVANPNQDDLDGDGIGDLCDALPDDADNDGVNGSLDNCPLIANPGQEDGDGDNIGDLCDSCPADPANDLDGDGICGDLDNCPTVANPDQADLDLNGIGDLCDVVAVLPKTGQQYCYSDYSSSPDMSTVIPCTGLGEDGDSQTGVAWPNPRFTINVNPANDNGSGGGVAGNGQCDGLETCNGTITDHLTGLIWLREANCFGYRMGGTQALGDVNGLADGACSLLDGSVAGDWRLPNIVEMDSLLFVQYENPAIPNTAGTGKWTPGDPFTNLGSNDSYWTSTTCPKYATAYRVEVRNGQSYCSTKNSASYNYKILAVKNEVGPSSAVSLAKTGQESCFPDDSLTPISCAGTGQDGEYQAGAVWSSPRFTINVSSANDDGAGGGIVGNGICDGSEVCDGTVLDNQTGLVWLQNANCYDSRIWSDALNDAKTLVSGSCGLSDGSVAGNWRLPNVVELRSLLAIQHYRPSLSNSAGTGKWSQGDPFLNVQLRPYWTSTTEGSSDTKGHNSAYSVDLDDGETHYSYKGLPYGAQLRWVWPVRTP